MPHSNPRKSTSGEVSQLPTPKPLSLGRFERFRPYLRRLGIRRRNIIRLLLPTIRQDGFVWATRGVPDTFLAWGTHEDFLETMVLRDGDIFLDIGAHVGRWAVRASQYFATVVAFEPSPMTNAVLRRNIELNKLSNIKVLQVALGEQDREEKLYFYNARGHDSLLGVHPVVDQTPQRSVDVITRRLDTIVGIHGLHLTKRSMVKIDTEGYEIQVLEGARQTIVQSHPRLLVEVHGRDNMPRVTSLLNNFGYPKPAMIDRGGATYVYAE